MTAEIIDGKKISEEIREEAKSEADEFLRVHGRKPGLAFILVGENPASQVYVRNKGKACEETGIYSVTDTYPDSIAESVILARIEELNANDSIDGILVQLPLPNHIDERLIIERISPSKDVDGFHPETLGKVMIGIDTLYPCTPAGIVQMLVRANVSTNGAHVVVVGRSNIVGKPVANMLLQKNKSANAIVTICHTGAKDIFYYTRQADILIAAMGKPEFIRGEHIRPGAVVIDVGMNRIPDASKKSGSRLTGDVHFPSAVEIASKITPVPGGVGLMTIAMLMKNTIKAAHLRNKHKN
jgi:methylenetetrahydrofolate dehydrogenase (NADP+)/methenyltetrahydrofolate cyclohydrolase